MSIKSIYNRRSIRRFQEKEVPLECLYEIINAGIAAPSSKNRQPWKYIVFGNEKKKELLNAMKIGLSREDRGITALPKSRFGISDAKNTLRIMEEAPVIIIVMNIYASSPFLQIDNDARISEICDSLSIGASIENMILAAEDMGLGSLWIANTCFAYSELTEYLETDKQLVGAIAIGYANERPTQRPRKPLGEIAEFRL